MKKFPLILSSLFLFLSFNVYADNNNLIVIKSPTNANEKDIGDYHLGEDFSTGFKSLGFDVETDYRTTYHQERNTTPLLSVYMRGYTKFLPPYDKGTNLLYIYYPMHNTLGISEHQKNKEELNKRKPMPALSNLDDDFQNYDLIAVASTSYAKKLKDAGIKAFYAPQFTNENKFYREYNEALATPILFVGSNWHQRTSLLYALEEGFEVAVYGYNWQNIVPQSMYKGTYINNDELHQYYSSAKIVLNDHRPDMKEFGFINNRIYDVTATGTMVVSDYMPEIEEIYGDTIPMYKNKEELKEILDYYLKNDKEREEKAKLAQAITLKNFTSTIVAKKILSTVQTFFPDKKLLAK